MNFLQIAAEDNKKNDDRSGDGGRIFTREKNLTFFDVNGSICRQYPPPPTRVKWVPEQASRELFQHYGGVFPRSRRLHFLKTIETPGFSPKKKLGRRCRVDNGCPEPCKVFLQCPAHQAKKWAKWVSAAHLLLSDRPRETRT